MNDTRKYKLSQREAAIIKAYQDQARRMEELVVATCNMILASHELNGSYTLEVNGEGEFELVSKPVPSKEEAR